MKAAPKLYAFLWKDWQEAKSYRLAQVTEFAGLVMPLVFLFFLSRLFRDVSIDSLGQYSENYIAYALVGLFVTMYSASALRAFSTALRRAQIVGNLETLFLTRTSLTTLLFGWSLYPFLRSTVLMMVFLIGGVLIVGLRFDNINVIGALLTIFLLILVMGSLGIVAAGFTLMFKRGDPFTALLMVASGLLSGTLYPVEVLPAWLQVVSRILPHTYAIETVRSAVLSGGTMAEIAPGIGVLALYATLLTPIGILTFRYAIRRAKMDGSLAHY